ncbi:MAG: hypothetical protein OHK0047_39860 [Leptolyngbyaceae cyanobacterium]
MVPSVQYSLDAIKNEVGDLVCEGRVDRHQPIYCLCGCFPAREWSYIECELERHGYLLRDHIGDLLSQETWGDD